MINLDKDIYFVKYVIDIIMKGGLTIVIIVTI